MKSLNANIKKAILVIAFVTVLVLLFSSVPNVSARVKQIDTQTTLNMPFAFPAQSSVSFSGQVTQIDIQILQFQLEVL